MLIEKFKNQIKTIKNNWFRFDFILIINEYNR